jgi:hypothetical protein
LCTCLHDPKCQGAEILAENTKILWGRENLFYQLYKKKARKGADLYWDLLFHISIYNSCPKIISPSSGLLNFFPTILHYGSVKNCKNFFASGRISWLIGEKNVKLIGNTVYHSYFKITLNSSLTPYLHSFNMHPIKWVRVNFNTIWAWVKFTISYMNFPLAAYCINWRAGVAAISEVNLSCLIHTRFDKIVSQSWQREVWLPRN